MTEKQTQTTKEEARILCARLLPHTTSVQNVDLVAFALEQAEKRGYERGKKDGWNDCFDSGMEIKEMQVTEVDASRRFFCTSCVLGLDISRQSKTNPDLCVACYFGIIYAEQAA